ARCHCRIGGPRRADRRVRIRQLVHRLPVRPRGLCRADALWAKAWGALTSSIPTATGRNQVMQIKFTRSGGLAAIPGLTVEGTVDVGGPAARVTSEPSKYRRDLAPDELERLREAVERVSVPKARAALASRAATVYDAHQYDITVTTTD